MMLFCPSLKRRSLGKLKKSIEARVEAEGVEMSANGGARSCWMAKRKCVSMESRGAGKKAIQPKLIEQEDDEGRAAVTMGDL